MKASKVELRKKMGRELEKHRALLPELSAKIVALLLKDPELSQMKKIGLFYPRPLEPNLLPLWKAHPEKYFFPKTDGVTMHFYGATKEEDFLAGSFSILEPKSLHPIDPKEIDLLIVPGLAFDKKGARLGSGKGFFDRFLSQHPIPTLGVCFSFQLLEQLPTEPWDIPVERLILETGFIF